MGSRVRVWRDPDFAKLWAADVVSQFGTQVTFLGLPLVAVATLGASPLEASVLQTVEWLPVVLVSLPVGAWVDRLRRRPILIASDAGRAVVLLAVPVAFALDALSLWLLYPVAFAVGVFAVCFDVAHRSYLPSLIEREHLVAANSALELGGSAARVAGPGLAGGIIGLLGAPAALALDAASFVGSAALLWRIRRPEPPPAPRGTADSQGAGLRGEVAEGLAYVRRHPVLAPLAANAALANLGLAVVEGILVVYMVRVLGLSAARIGLVFAVANVGLLAGAALAAPVARRLGVGPTVAAAAGLQAAGLLLVPLAPLAPIPLLVAGQLLRALGVVVYNVAQRSLRQALVPTRLQGRTNATLRFVGWGTIPLGNLLGGVLATLAGLQAAVWAGAAVGLLAVLPATRASVRALRAVPEPGEER